MKKHLKFSLLALLLPLAMFAQPGGGPPDGPGNGQGRERMEAMRVAYITQRVGLTTEEAQKFWPVFNEMQTELESIRQERHAMMDSHRDDPQMENSSEAEIKSEMQKMLELDQRELNIKKAYHTKFLAILPARKVALLYSAEEHFKRELIRRLSSRDRAEGERPGNGRP